MWAANLKKEECQILEKVLRQGQYMQIALSYQGEPHLIAMNYAWEGQRIYLHGANRGRKSLIFNKTVKVVFQVVEGAEIIPGEEACSISARFYSVEGRGTLFTASPEEKIKALDCFTRKYASKENCVYSQKILDATTVWVISISSLSGKIKGYSL